MANTRLGIVITLSTMTAFGALQMAEAQSMKSPIPWPKKPFSGDLMMAKLIKEGKVVPAKGHSKAAPSPVNLTCGPAPCTFRNVTASLGAGYGPANETPIAADPNNPLHLLTGANDYNCSGPSTLQGYYASSDGGRTWTRSCGTLEATGIGGAGDPGVAYDRNGVAYRSGIDFNNSGTSDIVVSHSSDNGITWSTPVASTPSVLGYLADKPWMEVDTNIDSPNANAIYVSSTQFAFNNDSEIVVSHSTDGGATWTTVAVNPAPAPFPKVDQFSDLAVAPNGDVYVTWMNCDARGPTGDCGGTTARMLISRSADGGNTWSIPRTVDTPALAPDSCGAFYGCLPNTFERVSNIPVVAVDGLGKLYVTDYTWTGTYMQVQVLSSTTHGNTWSAPVPVHTPTADQFFPWLNVSNTGAVGVTWLDRRLSASNVNYEAFGAVSTDGGATFPNMKISTAASNPFNDGFGSGFMGDYTGNAWAGTSLYQSWTDTRNGFTGQDEIGGISQ